MAGACNHQIWVIGVVLGCQVSVAAPPETSIDAARGVVTSGELTLAFHLAPDAEAPDQAAPAPEGLSPWKPGQAAAAGQQGPATDAAADSVRGDSPLMSSTRAAATHRRALQQQEQQQQQGAHKDWLFEKQLAAIELGWSEWLLQRGEASRGREQGRAGQPGAAALGRPRGEAPMGQHLFTVGIGGEIMATKLALEPDAPARPQSYRLGITMGLDLPSLRIKVAPPAPLLLPLCHGAWGAKERFCSTAARKLAWLLLSFRKCCTRRGHA